MPLFYPHKQTAIIFIICILGVLGTIWYVGRGNARSQQASNVMSGQQNTQVIQVGTAIATTTDWQKQFFANSTSTKLKNSTLTTNDPSTNEPETVTGQFGKKFFEQYMLLKQNNLTEDPTAIKAVVDQNIGDIVSTAPQAQVYDIRNVLIATTDNLAAERTYANTVGEILSLYDPKGDAATIATEALDKNDTSRIKEIEDIANLYSIMLKKLLAVPAPKTINQNHLALINAVSSMVFVSQGMSKVFIDPLQSIVSLAVYEKSLTSLQNSLLDLKYNFSQKGIQFSSNEPGIIFTLIN